MAKEKVIDYKEFRQYLQTFDCLICEQHDLFWRLIGHTAGVVKNPNGQLMVFESTSISKVSGISGVQLNPMGLWLDKYPGKVYVRQMIHDININWGRRRRNESLKKSDKFIEEYRGTSYPDTKSAKGLWYLIKSAWDSKILKKASTNVQDDSMIFCTDLYYRWLLACGKVIKGTVSSEREPDDVYPGEKIDKDLVVGVTLGKMIRIK